MKKVEQFWFPGKSGLQEKNAPANFINVVFPVIEQSLSLNSPFPLLPERLLLFLINSTSLGYLHYQRVCNPD